MFNWLKQLVAGKELAELDRIHTAILTADRWFHSDDNVAKVLEYVSGCGDGTVAFGTVNDIREEILNKQVGDYEIRITVEGRAGCGKSLVSHSIVKMLKNVFAAEYIETNAYLERSREESDLIQLPTYLKLGESNKFVVNEVQTSRRGA